jgi:hypothetical protein
MKKLRAIATKSKSIATPAGLTFIAMLAVAFWFSTSPSGLAQEQTGGVSTCSVCHKRTTTMTFDCSSLDYRRHLDHGDTMGACGVTPVENP